MEKCSSFQATVIRELQNCSCSEAEQIVNQIDTWAGLDWSEATRSDIRQAIVDSQGFLQTNMEKGEKMNGYLAFYRGNQKEIFASTQYEAQQKAAAAFKARKSYEVTVVLCEKDGVQVTHSTTEF